MASYKSTKMLQLLCIFAISTQCYAFSTVGLIHKTHMGRASLRPFASKIPSQEFRKVLSTRKSANSRFSFSCSSSPAPSDSPSTSIPQEDCGCGDTVSLGDLKKNLVTKIEGAAAKIRKMKDDGVKDKATLQPHIDELLSLKTQYQAVTGEPYDTPKKTPAKTAKPTRNDGSDDAVKLRGEQESAAPRPIQTHFFTRRGCFSAESSRFSTVAGELRNHAAQRGLLSVVPGRHLRGADGRPEPGQGLHGASRELLDQGCY
jgi:hypothetical protein